MVQGFVQGKGFQGGPCGAGEMGAIVLKVYEKPENIFGSKPKRMILQQFFHIFSGEKEYNFKVKRCFLPFHNGKAEGFYIFPEGIVLPSKARASFSSVSKKSGCKEPVRL